MLENVKRIFFEIRNKLVDKVIKQVESRDINLKQSYDFLMRLIEESGEDIP